MLKAAVEQPSNKDAQGGRPSRFSLYLRYGTDGTWRTNCSILAVLAAAGRPLSTSHYEAKFYIYMIINRHSGSRYTSSRPIGTGTVLRPAPAVLRPLPSVPCPLPASLFHLLFSVLAFALLAVLAPASAGNQVVAWGAGTVADPDNLHDFGQSDVPAGLTNAVQVVGGGRHSLALLANGTLKGWGDDSLLELNFSPAGVSNYVAVACGLQHSLALRANGTVAATAGDNSFGQISVPAGLSNVVAIACGFYHGLALKSDGTVVAWGGNNFDGVQINYGQGAVPPGLSNVVAIAAGSYHNLVLKSDGTLLAWGLNNSGQTNIPAGLSNVVAVAAGAEHNVVVKADGTLQAWGADEYGQLDGAAGLSNVVALAAGGWHTLALKKDGTVVAWGAGSGTNPNLDYGQSTVPSGLTNVVQVAAGGWDSLALVGSGPPKVKVPLTVAGWGTNGLVAQLPTRNGRVYRLEYNTAIAPTNHASTWTTFPLQAGLGTTNRFVDPSPTRSAAARFYRVSQW